MKNRGFTLIELLVVVLIIAILAAIAVPKYQIAVKTSRLKSILPTIKTIAESEQSYYLATGDYTKDLDNLDVDLSYTEKTCSTKQCSYSTSWGTLVLYDTWYPRIIFSVHNVAQVAMPYDFPKTCASCYRDNRQICNKLGTYLEPYDSKSDIYRICKL